MKNKKIIFHINSLGRGGAEHVLSMLSEYFANDGYEATIVTLWKDKGEYRLSNKVKRINLGDYETGEEGRLKRAFGRLLNLRKVIQKEKPDIVISFGKKSNFRSAFAMLGMKIPLLVSVRNDPQKDYQPYQFASKWMERKAAGCVFQTGEAQTFFGSRLQKKSRVIWNPVDEKYLTAEKHDGNGYFIANVGNLSKQKNQSLLLKAFSLLPDRFQETELRIYGNECEAGMQEMLEKYAAELGLTDRIKFMGQSSTLETELKDAALFVLPSDYEGMPNALAEAMTLGLPVIATDCPCGGCAMLIENGVSGILTPVGDEKKLAEAMEKLLTDRELAGAMGKKAAEIADRINPSRIYQEWKEYAELLTGN